MSSLSPAHESVWKELAAGKHVLALFVTAKSADAVYKQSRLLVEALRPCGFLQETDTDIQFVNGVWLFLRRPLTTLSLSLQNFNASVIELRE